MTAKSHLSKVFYYLQQAELTDVAAMVNNLSGLLESAERDNLFLAFQLMKSGGVPQGLLTHVLAIKLWHSNPTLRQTANQLFKKFAPADLQLFIKNNFRSPQAKEYKESRIASVLTKLTEHPLIKPAILGNMKLKLSKRGIKYCLENKTAPALQLLQELVEGETLYLNNFELTFLPEEVGMFTQLKTLNISGNLFQEVPRTLQNLTKLEHIHYRNTPLNLTEIAYLETTFPEIFASQYYSEGESFKTNMNFEEAVKYFSKAAQLKPSFGEAWHQWGACLLHTTQQALAVRILEKALQIYQDRIFAEPPSAYVWFCKACAEALQGQTSQSLQSLEKCIQLDASYKHKAFYEEELTNLFNNSEFLSIVA
jgi:tetratricopeptide (TPR) repeat protein